MGLFDGAETTNELLGQLVGYASMCWSTPEGAGDFLSIEAAEGVKDALKRLLYLNDDEKVLFDAQEAIKKVGLSEQQTFDVINEILNAGLLIRRRA